MTGIVFPIGVSFSRCDKCGEEVSPENDAVRIDAIATGNSIQLVEANARHFLPTGTCPGSPSRAQYIEGQPRDPRYPYVPELEPKFRQAHEQLLREHFDRIGRDHHEPEG